MKYQLLLSAWRDLYEKYRDKWKFAWAHRRELDRPDRTAQEAEFLPAALAVQDTPAGPLNHWGMRTIAGFFVLALLASILFHIDIIVASQGALIPSGQVKTIQSLEAAVVRRIAVAEGQKVRQGDVLVELFSPGVTTDSGRLQAEREASQTELARLNLLLQMLAGKGSGVGVANSSPASAAASSADLLNSRFREYLDKNARAEAEVQRRSAELTSVSEALNKVRESIPRLEAKVADYQDLQAQGYVSRHAALDQAQQLADARADAVIMQSRISEARAQLREAQQGNVLLLSEMRRTVLEQQRDHQNRLASVEQELAKYQDRDELMVIRAPIDGVISHLMTYTVGGVIPAAQTLMTIVPAGSALEVEAVVDNKDVGHIREGQNVEVKIESYPFTRFGLLTGKVIGISASAANDEKKGLVYKARIALPDEVSRKNTFPHPLIPGMNASAEIKIGTRRVIEYFLSPLIVSVKEAARER